MHELQKFLPRPSQNFAQKRLHYISLDFTENLDFHVNFTVKVAYFKDISNVCIVNHETIFLLHEPLGCIKIASLGFICIVLNPSGFALGILSTMHINPRDAILMHPSGSCSKNIIRYIFVKSTSPTKCFHFRLIIQ